jgi:hypothetical protein
MSEHLLTEGESFTPIFDASQVSSLTVDAGYGSRPVSWRTVAAHPVRTLTERCIIRIGGPSRQEYLLSERDAVPTGEGVVAISPAWLSEKKRQLTAMANLAPNWDSYGAQTPTTASLREAHVLLLWLALADLPPPDVFPTSDGGVQIEWHIYGVNAEVAIAPGGTAASVYFHDLRTADEWERPLSPTGQELRTIRTRLLLHGERP